MVRDGWKVGLPPGEYYEGMVDDFEVYFSPVGVKWHRQRTPEERENYIQSRDANHRAVASRRTEHLEAQ